jgi:HNH endonuclease
MGVPYKHFGPCSVDGCESPAKFRGWCSKHYQRWQKHGDPLGGSRFCNDLMANFWRKVNKDGPIPEHRPELGACWAWTGSRLPEGYGTFRVGTIVARAHRFAYEQFVGPIPEGLTIDHLCINPPCVNPAHLEPVTNAVNVLRGGNPAAENARKTHCARGHEFTAENTYIWKGGRYCKACHYVRSKKWRLTHKL